MFQTARVHSTPQIAFYVYDLYVSGGVDGKLKFHQASNMATFETVDWVKALNKLRAQDDTPASLDIASAKIIKCGAPPDE